MIYEIKEINISAVSEEYFERFFHFSDILFKELHPKDSLPSREQTRKLILYKREGEERRRFHILLKETGEIVGQLLFLYRNENHEEYEKNKNIAEVYISLIEGHRERALLLKLMSLTVKLSEETTIINTIETCCFREYEWEIWENIGAKLAIEGKQSRLYLDEIDWNLIEKWRKHGHKIAKIEQIDLISFQDCPDDLIEDYSKLYTEIMNLVPFGEFEWKPADVTPQNRREREERNKLLGSEWYTLVTREKNGKISGLTEIFYSKFRPEKVEQELTGISPEFRGRGLGKWLKAEMVFFIRERFPEARFIETGNADVNAPMLSINDRMGFKVHLREKCYTISVKKIKEKIN